MNAELRNKFAMYKAVRSVLEANESSWNGIPAFQESVMEFYQLLHDFETSAYHQFTEMDGVTDNKTANLLELLRRTTDLAGALTAYASRNKDVKLLKQVNLSTTKIRGNSIVTSLINCDKIIEKVVIYQAQLDDYGVTAEELAIVQQLRSEMDSLAIAPRQALINRKMYTQSLDEIEIKIDQLLKLRLDKFVLRLKVDHPNIYVLYKNARIIVNNHGGSSRETTEPPQADPDDGIE